MSEHAQPYDRWKFDPVHAALEVRSMERQRDAADHRQHDDQPDQPYVTLDELQRQLKALR